MPVSRKGRKEFIKSTFYSNKICRYEKYVVYCYRGDDTMSTVKGKDFDREEELEQFSMGAIPLMYNLTTLKNSYIDDSVIIAAVKNRKNKQERDDAERKKDEGDDEK